MCTHVYFPPIFGHTNTVEAPTIINMTASSWPQVVSGLLLFRVLCGPAVLPSSGSFIRGSPFRGGSQDSRGVGPYFIRSPELCWISTRPL